MVDFPWRNVSLPEGTPLKTNMTGWKTNHLKMYLLYFILKNRDFPAIYISFCQGTQPQSQ